MPKGAYNPFGDDIPSVKNLTQATTASPGKPYVPTDRAATARIAGRRAVFASWAIVAIHAFALLGPDDGYPNQAVDRSAVVASVLIATPALGATLGLLVSSYRVKGGNVDWLRALGFFSILGGFAIFFYYLMARERLFGFEFGLLDYAMLGLFCYVYYLRMWADLRDDLR